MLDRYELLHTAAAAMLVLLLRLHPSVRAALGRHGSSWVLAGVLLPLGDNVAPLWSLPDSITFLTRPHTLHSVSTGMLVLAGVALLGALIAGPRQGLAAAGLAGAGFLPHLFFDGVTEAGIWFGPASLSARSDWPVFAKGHLLLVGLLAAALVANRVSPERRRWLLGGAWALVALYGLGGMAQYAVAFSRAAAAPGATRETELLPGNPWRTRWLAVTPGDQDVQISVLGPWGKPLEQPAGLPLWNDEARFLEMAGDPIVRRFYREIFRHPVVTVESRAADATLVMREAVAVDRDESGPQFTLSWASDGRERTYEVEGFR